MTLTRPLRILHVDDDPRVRGVMAELLRETLEDPLQLSEGDDGSEVLALFSNHQPDLVVMDFEMPEMDGLQATEVLLRQYPTAKVVILTLHDSSSVRAAAKRAGAVDLVVKDELRGVVEIARKILATP